MLTVALKVKSEQEFELPSEQVSACLLWPLPDHVAGVGDDELYGGLPHNMQMSYLPNMCLDLIRACRYSLSLVIISRERQLKLKFLVENRLIYSVVQVSLLGMDLS